MKSAQCPDCTGQIKRVDATGKCHSCFPCPECIDGYTTPSVSCGSTVLFGTDISCVLVELKPKASSQTRHLTSLSVTVTSSSKFTIEPVTSSSHPLVISATSSLISAGSSIIQDEGSTKDPNTENILPLSSYSKWKKHTIIYISSAASLVIIIIAIWCRFKLKNKHRSQSSGETPDTSPTSPVHQPSTAQDDEACHINFATNSVVYSRTRTSEMGDRSLPGTGTNLFEGKTNITTGNYCLYNLLLIIQVKN